MALNGPPKSIKNIFVAKDLQKGFRTEFRRDGKYKGQKGFQ
jgi:hypothetical protein